MFTTLNQKAWFRVTYRSRPPGPECKAGTGCGTGPKREAGMGMLNTHQLLSGIAYAHFTASVPHAPVMIWSRGHYCTNAFNLNLP